MFEYLDGTDYSDEELRRYMELYKIYKLSNTLPADEQMYFAGIQTDQFDSRFAELSDYIDDQTVVLWVDALGAEWLPLLLKALAKRKDGTVVYHSCGLAKIPTANNEIGTIQHIKELSEISHRHGAVFHTDAVQAVGHIRIDVHDLGVDMLSASAHKFNGPKGIGFLYVRKGIDMSPYISGGGQEYGLRSGTENVASIVGMAVALRENIESLEKNQSHIQYLESLLLRLLDESDIIYQRNGANHVPGNISLSFPGHSGESILHRLDLQGICISTGSSCNSKYTVVSHVLKAIGLPDDIAQSTVRISLGKYNSEDEIISIVESLSKL